MERERGRCRWIKAGGGKNEERKKREVEMGKDKRVNSINVVIEVTTKLRLKGKRRGKLVK